MADPTTNGKKRVRDPEQVREWSRRRRERHPERVKDIKRRSYLKHREKRIAVNNAARLRRRYGLTPGQYEAMVVAQHGRCAICQDASSRLVIDHCHASGVVRALLCGPCNRMIGLGKERADVLRKAADYCENHVTLRLMVS